jgi:hypothetical protein
MCVRPSKKKKCSARLYKRTTREDTAASKAVVFRGWVEKKKKTFLETLRKGRNGVAHSTTNSAANRLKGQKKLPIALICVTIQVFEVSEEEESEQPPLFCSDGFYNFKVAEAWCGYWACRSLLYRLTHSEGRADAPWVCVRGGCVIKIQPCKSI